MTALGDAVGLDEPQTNFLSLCLRQRRKPEAVCVLQKSSIQWSHFHHPDLCNIFPAEVQILVQ